MRNSLIKARDRSHGEWVSTCYRMMKSPLEVVVFVHTLHKMWMNFVKKGATAARVVILDPALPHHPECQGLDQQNRYHCQGEAQPEWHDRDGTGDHPEEGSKGE